MKKVFGSRIYRQKNVENSMDWAREFLHEAEDGSLFIADEIIRAQGRQGRTWQLKPGQLCITALLKPSLQEPVEDISLRLNQLGLALAVAIVTPLVPYNVGLKWPNDFFCNKKKVGGMLLQPVWEGKTLMGIILGFALNVTTEFLPDDPLFIYATSISAGAGRQLEIRPLFYEILSSLDHYYALWKEGAHKKIYLDWRKHLLYLGQELIMHDRQGKEFNATIMQVMPNGDAIIKTEKKAYEVVPFHLIEQVILKPS